MNASAMTTPDEPQPADRDEISEVVAALERAQQNELVDEFIDLFREDAIWTTGTGRRLTGKQEIADFTRQVLPGAMHSSTATYEILHVLFIRADVAAVKVRQRPVTLSGEPIEDQPEGSPLYVMAKERGRWLLVACQNTQVQ